MGTTLRPWEFTPCPSLLPQNVCREAQGEMSPPPPAMGASLQHMCTIAGMGGPFKELAGGK